MYEHEWIGEVRVRAPQEDDTEIVYFVQAEHGGPIKIGVTSQGNLERRGYEDGFDDGEQALRDRARRALDLG